MKIVIIGDGKVGHKLTIQLSEENYDVVQMRKCRKKQECRALILLWHVHRQTN